MHHRSARMKPLSTWLRWVLAAILILNGALAPLGMTHAMSRADTKTDSHAMSMGAHCHHHDASKTVDAAKPLHGQCPGCDGNTCQCGCISSVALPTTFSDLRPLTPQDYATNWSVPETAASPPSRLLRPPIG